MATERQIAANRANAKHSTGPKSLAGRMTSSRNAFRHGLSGPLPLDIVTSAKIEAITHALVGDATDGEKRIAASELAKAQMDLLQVRAVRAHMVAALDWERGRVKDLARLAALDRYERLAHTKRKRASGKLFEKARCDF